MSERQAAIADALAKAELTTTASRREACLEQGTDSFYCSHIALYARVVVKGSLTQLLEMAKNYSDEHIFTRSFCCFRLFSLVTNADGAISANTGRHVCINSLCKSLTNSGPGTVLSFCFWTAAGEKLMLLCLVVIISVIAIKLQFLTVFWWFCFWAMPAW